MANPHRATVTVDLGEPPVAHDLCLTNQALVEIEAELKVETPELLAKGFLGITKAVVVIHAGLKGAGKKVERKAVMELLDGMKPGDVMQAAVRALSAAFTDPEPNPPREGESPSA